MNPSDSFGSDAQTDIPDAFARSLDHRGPRRFLEDDDVGIARTDDGQQRVLAAGPAALDVVAEQADLHSASFFSTSVR